MARRPPFGVDVGAERDYTPNNDGETAGVALDEPDKGVSKRELARSLGTARSARRNIAENRERCIAESFVFSCTSPNPLRSAIVHVQVGVHASGRSHIEH